MLCKSSGSVQAAFCITIAFVVFLSGCGSPVLSPSIVSPSVLPPTIPTAASLPPASQLPAASEVPAFPLGGDWNGVAYNGNFMMTVTLKLSTTCLVGSVCGRIDLAEIPCSASFTLLNEQGFLYEFKAGDFVGTCGLGQDFLEALPDGTIKYTSRGDYGETNGILTRQSVRNALIFDDDGSPDGTTALLYLLSRSDVTIKSVGISYGEAHPAVYIQHMGRMLEDYGFSGILLGAGMDGSLSGSEGFPEWLRDASGGFWGWKIPNPNKTYPVEASADLLISLLQGSSQPLDLFFSGPVTNLALALRQAPGIKDHIGTLYMMAGAVFVPGNVHDFYPENPNVFADWNPYSDPVAYSEVFASGIHMVLIPLDATNLVKISQEDTRSWRSGGRLANFAANIYDGLMDAATGQTYIWDLLAAAVMTEPTLCSYQDLHIDVGTVAGDHFGQFVVVPAAQPNIRVCLVPNEPGIKQVLVDVFSNSR
jgi:pyrimidine-specific ribonucleoside hydrolase